MRRYRIRPERMSFLAFFLFLIPLLLQTGCSNHEVKYKPGTYINDAEGYYSDLKVSVRVNKYEIEAIEILAHEEPEILADVVFEDLPPMIIKDNSVDIDGIAGATYTSEALLDAVGMALEQAKVVSE